MRLCHTEIVPDYCTCGAQLPPDARFCHKCGKPQYDYPGVEPAEQAQTPPPLPPPLPVEAAKLPEIGFHNRIAVRIGITVAVAAMVLVSIIASILPATAFLGFFCAGMIAAVWYVRRTGEKLSIRGGARIGWITGLFCFTAFLLVFTIVVVAITNPDVVATMRNDASLSKNPSFQEMLKMVTDPHDAVMNIIVRVIAMFIFLTTLPMLGGAVGAKLSERRA